MTEATARTPQRKSKQGKEAEIVWTYSPRLTPGEYPAFCRHAKVYRDRQYKRWVCAAHFDILDTDPTKRLAQLTWYMNLGERDQPHAGRRRVYWSAWVQANGKPPVRNDRLSPRVFQSRYARVLVGDTTKNYESKPTAPGSAYSVVRKVVRWETGGAE